MILNRVFEEASLRHVSKDREAEVGPAEPRATRVLSGDKLQPGELEPVLRSESQVQLLS